MYLISKFFTAFFLPPGIFIIFLLIAAFLAKRKNILFFLVAIIFYAISIKPIANYLIAPLESFKSNDLVKPKAVVVLGGGSNDYDIIKTYQEPFKRLIYALYIAKEHKLPLIFAGSKDEVKSAKEDINLLKKRFNLYVTTYFVENSLNTHQNAIYSARVFEDKRLKKDIFLITSAYHMKRSTLEFKDAGFKVVSMPVNFYFEDVNKIYDYLPNIRSLYTSYKALHEYVGIAFFYLKNANF